MSVERKSAIPVVLGCMQFGEPESATHVRVTDLDKVGQFIDLFGKYGHTELDTARVYGKGTSEEYLGKLNVEKRGYQVSSKLYPYSAAKMGAMLNLGPDNIPLTRSNIAKHIDIALKNTGVSKLKIFYLHGPERFEDGTRTPVEETLKALDEQYKLGKFETLGVSNFMSHEVAELVVTARLNGWIQPKVYQGNYSLAQRITEPELFPCLRKYGMSFYAFSPVAGGILTGRVRKDTQFEKGSRYDDSHAQGQMFRKRFFNDNVFKALDEIDAIGKKYNLTTIEIALRWIAHHSQLKAEHGDAVIIGASKLEQLEENLNALNGAALPEEVVSVVDALWEVIKPTASPYWH
ncbi:aldo/keto reductase [Wallemia mellicola]|uniref:Aldo/keto reductase n=1 Tax=Wallemia mellicola TaxID=1708541 RepID=A0A4T0TKJ1_9BASI|nr:aldo/keto reductase [Wallemia mellicola]TIC65437.1 aldo/keto reductase [Wallemia mellicola]